MKSKNGLFISCLQLLFSLGLSTQLQSAELQVEITRIKHLGKPIYVRVYHVSPEKADQKDWPDEAMFEAKFIPTKNTDTLEFKSVDTGSYFISLYQDLNNNEMLDKTRKGTPKEPYALSNNPILSHAPKLSEMMFEVNAESTAISVFIRERRNRNH